ncbi:TldD/PmbA family protein [Rhodococcus sp. SJ-2]
MNVVDPDFLALPLPRIADAALSVARAAGAQHADVRVHRVRTESLMVRDGAVQSVVDASDLGVAVRVLLDGTWGFASHPDPDPDGAAYAATRAVAVAQALRPINRDPVEWAPEPVYRGATWCSDYRVDPFTVSTDEKVAVLTDYSRRLLDADGVHHVAARCDLVKEQGFYADLAGSSITQQRVRVHPQLEATTVDRRAGTFESMRTLAAPTGRGWEYVCSDAGWDWSGELAALPELLVEKAHAPTVTAGPTDLVIDPTNLWLTIHESVGHATEYDRAIGYEAAYAGTSFATPDRLGTLRYGSAAMHVRADRTEPHGLATVGFDDDGVAAQSWDLVCEGRLVGYQLDRAFAAKAGVGRSNGCAYADSAHHVPLQRMANVSLQPDPQVDRSTADLIGGVEDGLYVVGDRSWSIDMQRYNFQFTGQRFYRIRGGRLAGQVRDAAYQSSTTDFWGALEAVGGRSTWQLGGAMNCGKAQPGQVAAVGHGCPSVLLRQINVLNTRQEGSR